MTKTELKYYNAISKRIDNCTELSNKLAAQINEAKMPAPQGLVQCKIEGVYYFLEPWVVEAFRDSLNDHIAVLEAAFSGPPPIKLP